MDQDRIMKVTDDQGNEVEMFILFTTNLKEFNKNYIFYTDPTDETGQVYVSSFTEDNRLQPVENEEEWNVLEDVFNEFVEEANNQQGNDNCSNCQGNCEGQCDVDCENSSDECCCKNKNN